MRFFSLEGDIDPDALQKATAQFDTAGVRCRIISLPPEGRERINKRFLTVEVPAALATKDLVFALRRGARTVDELAWTAFHNPGLDSEMSKHWAPRWLLEGLPADARWSDGRGGWYQFYFLPGRLEPEKIEERYERLLAPFTHTSLGKIVRETFSWPLVEPINPAAAKRSAKAIGKLPGVHSVSIDPAAGRMQVVVELAGLRASGPARPYPADAQGSTDKQATDTKPVRASFDTNPLFDLLEKERIAVAASDSEKK